MEWLDRIREGLNKGIPGEASHIRMSPVNRPLSSVSLINHTNYRESAVAINLYKKEGTLHCILIQRSEYEGTHSGQVAFPGGKKDVEDDHLEYTARRETYEETGIPVSNGLLLGELTSVFIPVSNFLVQPFLYFHDYLPELQANEREVAEIFSFPLEELLNENSFSTMSFRLSTGIIQKNIPCFVLSERKVWGATALILNEFRDVLLFKERL